MALPELFHLVRVKLDIDDDARSSEIVSDAVEVIHLASFDVVHRKMACKRELRDVLCRRREDDHTRSGAISEQEKPISDVLFQKSFADIARLVAVEPP